MEYIDHWWEAPSEVMEAVLWNLGWTSTPDPENPISLISEVAAIAPTREVTIMGTKITFALIRATEQLPLPAHVHVSEIGPSVVGVFA
jgi:hypothetical protein